MKKLSLLLIALLFTMGMNHADAADLAGNSINLKGNSNTSLGNYEIKELPPVDLNGEQMRTFELTYQNAQKSVLIYLDQRANCRDYIVRSKNLEVCYTCKKSSFGAQQLTGKHMKYKPELNELFLAQDELEKQKKISEGGLSIDSALGIIASYYPNLLKRSDLLN
jgi:hypothetical protein